MKLIVFLSLVTTMMLPILATAGDGQDGKSGKAGQKQAGQVQAGQKRGVKPGGPGPGGQRLGGRGQMDAAQVAARMMQEMDKDGDNKLNVRELTALLEKMRSRMGGRGGENGSQPGMRRGGLGQSRPGAGQLGQGISGKAGKGRRGGNNDPAAGGEKPLRPKA